MTGDTKNKTSNKILFASIFIAILCALAPISLVFEIVSNVIFMKWILAQDELMHVALFYSLSCASLLQSKAKNFALLMMFLFFFAIALEALHALLPYRNFSIIDIVCNLSGIMFFILSLIMRKRLQELQNRRVF